MYLLFSFFGPSHASRRQLYPGFDPCGFRAMGREIVGATGQTHRGWLARLERLRNKISVLDLTISSKSSKDAIVYMNAEAGVGSLSSWRVGGGLRIRSRSHLRIRDVCPEAPSPPSDSSRPSILGRAAPLLATMEERPRDRPARDRRALAPDGFRLYRGWISRLVASQDPAQHVLDLITVRLPAEALPRVEARVCTHRFAQ